MTNDPKFDPATEHSSRWVRAVIRTLSRPGATWAVLAVCLIATALVSLHARKEDEARTRLQFNTRAEALQNAIFERLERYALVLRGAGGLFAASVSVERQEWQSYVESLDLAGRYPGLLSLGFAENVATTNLPAFLANVRNDTAGQFPPDEFKVWPPAIHTNLFVVKYTEPFAFNRPALGYDIGSEPARREAAEQARDTGRAAVTRKVRLVQAPQKPGVLLLLPIYFNGAPTATPGERRAALEGWAYAAFVVGDLLADIRHVTGNDLEFEIYDGTDLSPETRLLGKEISPANTVAGRPPAEIYERTTTMPFENRTWTFRFRAPRDLNQNAGLSAVSYLATAGLCISLLIFGIARSMATTSRRAVALARQMTERRQLAERAMASSSDGIFILDAERERCPILYANPAFVKLTGHSTTGHLGDETLTMLRGGTSLTDLSKLRSGAQSDRPTRTVVREYRNGDSPFWIQFSLSPVRDERGQTTHYVGIAEDITDRRRAELAIQESQERLALVIQGSQDGIWDWNVITNEVYFSPRWKSMLGYAGIELENKFETWEELLHPDDRERAQATLQEYFSGTRMHFELEHRLRHKDGSYRWILARGVALRDDAGKPVRMAGSHVDLTERKLAEEELKRTCGQLSQSQSDLRRTVEELRTSHAELEKTQLELIQAAKLESIGTLAAGVAHEVKNPLQTMLMGLEYLNRNLPDKDGNTTLALTDMNDAVKRADCIVRELLHFSTATHLDFIEQDLNTVVNHALWLVKTQLVAARINLELNLDQALPPVWIDRGKIEQVLLNLFINAHQAMGQNGTLTVKTRAGQFENLDPLRLKSRARFNPIDIVVVLEIQDTGPGIPETHLTRIFDPFFTTKPVGVGTGLGLSVVKKIVDLHEGAIEMRNAPEGGALAVVVFKATNQGMV